jgi:hypothetical protein
VSCPPASDRRCAVGRRTRGDLHGGETPVRKKYGVTITAFKCVGQPWTYTSADTVLSADDTILDTAPTRKAEAFSQLQ